ncbi:tRNA (adenosine(37)-N6)-threonylcarbamoyltransferase complex transferase subunit TsaD [Thalassoglobus sp. JC818]|uniref:tRNA (adenosine(37)-N6)-threonylcarbamoyltransferase complex transferase subunit TsaD n=1 Tax=Thalassoglobus sp. JC818 TaxID=3232136 RepID=UPI003459C0A9
MVNSTSDAKVLLALESSCDETAAAIIDDQLRVLSSVVATQDELHQRFGGVVPEIASRAHLENLLPVIDEALTRSGKSLEDLSAIAVMTEPGLVGSLLVGLTAAKTLALVTDRPLVTVNHIHAHLFACQMEADEDIFPAMGLVVSGGHTNLYDCRSATEFELVGSTIDDAAGEAFDKAAAILGLPYPGGPFISRVAEKGDPKAFRFPRTFIKDERLAFSFSGIKTAIRYTALGQPGSKEPVPDLNEQRIADLAASFQEAVVDVLISKCRQAAERYGRTTLCIGGGVAANLRFRERLAELASQTGYRIVIAPPSLCTDNAAMAAIAWKLLEEGKVAALDADVVPGLVRLKQ